MTYIDGDAINAGRICDRFESLQKCGITGAIAGDIVGSVYEFDNIKSVDFNLFTPFNSFTEYGHDHCGG